MPRRTSLVCADCRKELEGVPSRAIDLFASSASKGITANCENCGRMAPLTLVRR